MSMRFTLLPLVVLAAAAPMSAYAVEYLTVEAAQKLMFPDATGFTPVHSAITAQQWAELEQRTHTPHPAHETQVLRAERGGQLLGYLYLDEVIGKTELINYAVSLSPDGKVRQVEILTYRESHGYEVHNPRWRAQFSGKDVNAPVSLGDDIANISGATLSCRHLTEGVRRVLALHALISAKA